MFQAFLRGHSHLKPCWSRGSQAWFDGMVHVVYLKYNSRQNVDVEGKRGNIFIFGLRKQCDTRQAWISFGEAVLFTAEIKFDCCWGKTESPSLHGRAVRVAVPSALGWFPDILNTFLGQLLRACAVGMLWEKESVGRGWAACNQRLWSAPGLWDHFPWYWDYQNTL